MVTVRRSYVTTVVNQRVLFGLQERMFARLQRLSHEFYGRSAVGDLMSRLSSDLNVVQDATTAVLAQGAFLLLSAIGAAITALVLSPLLGALVLVVVPLFAVSYVALLSRIRVASREVGAVYGQVAATMHENLSAHAVVKSLGLEERAVGSYRSRLRGLLRAIERIVLLSSLFEASVGMAVALGQLLVIGVGGWLVIEGRLTVGTLVAFVGLLPTFFQPGDGAGRRRLADPAGRGGDRPDARGARRARSGSRSGRTRSSWARCARRSGSRASASATTASGGSSTGST